MQEDVQNDSRGRGAGYLAQHPLQPHELVRGSGVYHSSASAVAGSCWIFESADARTAVAAAGVDREDCPMMFCTCCWDPTTGQQLAVAEPAQGGRKRSSASAQSVSKRRRAG